MIRQILPLILGLLFITASPAYSAGLWSDSEALNSTANLTNSDDNAPYIKADSNGNWVAVWESDNTMSTTVGTDKDIFVSRSSDNGVSWTTPSVLNSNAASDSGQDKNPKVATDGYGNWLAVWQSDDSLDGSLGTDDDILVARSSDYGATWSAPMALNANAGSDSGNDQVPEISTDNKGNWVVAWYSNDSLGSTIGTDWDILVSRSTDNGASWSTPGALNNNATTDTGSDFLVKIGTDRDGTWVSIWQSSENLGGSIGTDDDILVSRSTDNGVSWTAPAALNSNATSDITADINPQLAGDLSGNWVVVWQSGDSLGGTIGNDFDILVSRSNDFGVSWSTVTALNSNASNLTGDDTFPHVLPDGDGNWLAVWLSADSLGGTIGSDYDILVSHSGDYGASWSAASVLNSYADTDTSVDHYPVIATDGNGNWVTAWRTDNSLGGVAGGDYDIIFSRSVDNGSNWSSPAVITGNETVGTFIGHDDEPSVTTDKNGNWVSVWSSKENLDNSIGNDNDILVSRSTDNGKSWTTPIALNSNAASDSDNDRYPEISTDGEGNWLVVWQSEDSLTGTIGSDWDILVSHSSDNGSSWSAPIALNSNAGSDSGNDYFPRIATDSNGNWLVVWESEDSLAGTIGSDSDVLISRSSDNGANWTVPNALNSAASSDADNDLDPTITTDANGNWLVVWESTNTLGSTIGTDKDILLSRSTDNGNTWSTQTALNTNAGSDSGGDFDPVVATDGNGNWVATWASGDSLGSTIGTDWDILVARSTDNGTSWTAPAAVNDNSGSDEKPHIQTDGNGNWLVAWISEDSLGGTIETDADILFSNSSDNGNTWSSVAALNSGAENDSEDDNNPNLATDGNGNWLVVWDSEDTKGNTIGDDRDIFVSRSADSDMVTLPLIGGGNESINYSFSSTPSASINNINTNSGLSDSIPQGNLNAALDITSSSPGNPGYSVVISFTLSASSAYVFSGFWKYGIEAAGDANHWYDFGTLASHSGGAYDGTGYEILNGGKTLNVYLTDNIRGDDVLTGQDGQIIDAGLPIIVPAVVEIPAISYWSLSLMILLIPWLVRRNTLSQTG